MKAHATVVLGGKIWPAGSEIPDELIEAKGMNNPAVIGDQSEPPEDDGGGEPPAGAVNDDGDWEETFVQSETSVTKVMERVDSGLLSPTEAMYAERNTERPRVTLIRALNELMTDHE